MKKLIRLAAAMLGALGALAASSMMVLGWLSGPVAGIIPLHDYLTGNLTTGTKKRQWVMNQPGRIVGVEVNSETAGTTGSAVIDVMINGTTIWTTTGNRPTLATTVAGRYTASPPDGAISYKAGDVIRYDVISASTTPQTNTSISILCKPS